MMTPEEAGPPAGKLKLKITCPLYQVVERTADRVLLPTYDGVFEVLPRRAPLFIQLKPGILIVREDGKEEEFLVSSGLCEVRRDICSVIAWAGRPGAIQPERIRQQLQQAELFLQKDPSALRQHELLARIDFLKMVLEKTSET